jgi:hypothetical protein
VPIPSLSNWGRLVICWLPQKAGMKHIKSNMGDVSHFNDFNAHARVRRLLWGKKQKRRRQTCQRLSKPNLRKTL